MRQPLLSLLSESYFTVTAEEQRQCAGSDVRTGNRLIDDVEDLLGRLFLIEQLDQILRVLLTVGMRDPDDLLLGILDEHIVALRERVDRFSSADHLGKVDDLAVLVALEDRLDL